MNRKRKNWALRMSAYMMSALLVVGSAAPAYAADDLVVADQQTSTDETSVSETGASDENTESTEATQDIQVEKSADSDTEEASQDSESAADAEDTDADETAEVQEEASLADEASTDTEATETSQTGFGTANTQLSKGTYTVPAALMNASNITSASMAGSCIAGDATLVVAEDGSAKVTVPLQAVTVATVTAWATDWNIYQGDLKSDKVATEYTTNTDGNVDSITFTIPDKSADGAYVNMYVSAMNYSPDAFLKLDYANASVVKTIDTAALEASIKSAEGLTENTYTKASWDSNKDAIDSALTAAKTALEAKESQEAVDTANTTLTEAVGKLVEAGDSTELQTVIDQAKALDENDYTAKSWENWSNSIQKQITKAETLIANRDTQKKLDSQKSTLTRYIAYLVKKYDTTNLEAKIAEAQALKEDDYTADSWKAADLETVIGTAQEAIDSRGDKDAIVYAYDTLADAMDKLVENTADGVTVGRGSFQKKLKPGTYSLPIEILHSGKSSVTNQYTVSNYMTYTSMAKGCFTGNATVVIHEDGTATLTTGVQAITAMGVSGAASDWTIYASTQDFLDGKANSTTGVRYNAHVDATKVQAGKKKPSQISFTIPDLKQNVVAARMYIEVMSLSQDACIGLDWKNIEKVSDETSATSTVEKTYPKDAAPDTLTQLKDLKAGETVKLTEDLTLTENLTVKGGTIDLNGHTLAQADNLIRIKGDVSIVDSSAEKTGKITSEAYATSTYTTTSIAVLDGSLTVDGVTIDGQIGNGVYNNESIAIQTDSRVAITIKNSTLTNSRGKETVYMEYNEKGADVTIDGSILGKIGVGYGADESTTITNSTTGQLNLDGAEATIENVTADAGNLSNYFYTEKTSIENSDFTSLTYCGSGDLTLESVTIKTSEGSRNNALTNRGSGQITIKDGVFESSRGYVISNSGAPIAIEGGYFKGAKGSIDGAYTTPTGQILGDVTEGEYAGYQTLVEGTEPEVENPVATIYNADGSVAKQISEEKAEQALTYAQKGQTVKLNTDLEVDSLSFYKDCILDLNGHSITESSGIAGYAGTCHVIDSSEAKTGKIVGAYYIFNGNSKNTSMILDNVTAEAMYGQGMSVGSMYIINGSKMNNVTQFNAAVGGGITYVRDSICTVAESVEDAQSVMDAGVRASQYTVTKTGDRTFTVTVNELGKAMRAFEELDSSLYTKTSYEAAKAVYDEVDGSADEDVQGDVITTKAKELNDAVDALVLADQDQEITGLASSINKKYGDKAFNLGGKAQTKLTYKSSNTKIATVSSTGKVTIKGTGTVKILVTATQTEAYKSASKTVTIKVAKATPTVKTKVSKKTIKYNSLKKKTQSFSIGASVNSKGKISCKKVSGSSKIKVSTSGKISLKKCMKKGTYKVKVKISAKARGYYNAGSKTVTVTVKVK